MYEEGFFQEIWSRWRLFLEALRGGCQDGERAFEELFNHQSLKRAVLRRIGLHTKRVTAGLREDWCVRREVYDSIFAVLWDMGLRLCWDGLGDHYDTFTLERMMRFWGDVRRVVDERSECAARVLGGAGSGAGTARELLAVDGQRFVSETLGLNLSWEDKTIVSDCARGISLSETGKWLSREPAYISARRSDLVAIIEDCCSEAGVPMGEGWGESTLAG
jgi:hypothetical protein